MKPSRLSTYLKLGRVSNLPTVWTNTLAGIAVAGGTVTAGTAVLLATAFSCSYVGGMFLNDAFDRRVDARERPERPIPSGDISAGEVFGIGGLLLAAGTALVWLAAKGGGHGLRAMLSALALSAAIVAYDAWHKGNPLSPLLMGICRALVYLTAGICVVGAFNGSLVASVAVLLCYLMGLTYVAKQENLVEFKNLWPLALLAAPLVVGFSAARSSLLGAVLFVGLAAWVVTTVRLLKDRKPGNIPKAVVRLIAAISLVDALLIAGTGMPALAALAAGGFFLTLVLQRFVKGT